MCLSSEAGFTGFEDLLDFLAPEAGFVGFEEGRGWVSSEAGFTGFEDLLDFLAPEAGLAGLVDSWECCAFEARGAQILKTL